MHVVTRSDDDRGDGGDDDDDDNGGGGGGDDVGDDAREMVASSLSVEQCVSSSMHISVSSDSLVLVLGTDSVESDIDVGDDDAES
jgi:hypothetical protein